MYTVLCCGKKGWSDLDKVYHKLSDLCDAHKLWHDDHPGLLSDKICVVTGDSCIGVDEYASCWAGMVDAMHKYHKLDAKYGIRASAMRDQEYFEKYSLNCVLVFGQDSGTDNIVRLAKFNKVEVKFYA